MHDDPGVAAAAQADINAFVSRVSVNAVPGNS